MKILLVFMLSILCSCTYNVSMAHTEGQASDTIDDTQSPSNTVSPTLNLPIIPK